MSLVDLQAEHSFTLEEEVKQLQKQINNITFELKITQEDLAKAKSALHASRVEVEAISKQRDDARATATGNKESSSQLSDELSHLKSELSAKADDLAALTEMLSLTKSLNQIAENHAKELEEAAKGRADEVTQLKAAHDEYVTTFATQKSELLFKLSDLEGELATLQASKTTEAVLPKSNGREVQSTTPGVTKEELQRLHEAHNLKLHDLMSKHDKELKALSEQLETARKENNELQQEVGRKTMEIQYLEQDQEDSQETIMRYVDLLNDHPII